MIQGQFQAMRQAICTIYRHKTWLNDPLAIQTMENKLYQITLATQTGLAVPKTLVTSDPEGVRNFYSECRGDIIVKMLAPSPILNEVMYTNRVTPEHMQRIDSVKMSPSIFQAYVPKAYELRITAVGEKYFPVKIHSQEDEATSLDWRRKPKLNDFEVKMEKTILPREVEDSIRKFMTAAGLRFGCIDMIMTPEGEHVFLEVNPNGQWYFVQLRVEVKIAQAIADLFVT